jgi:hypothetical protein
VISRVSIFGSCAVHSQTEVVPSEKMASLHDVPLLIKSKNASSERRISPAWTISQLRARLEPITGIPVSAQKLQLGSVVIEAVDEDATSLASFGVLQPYAELQVSCREFLLITLLFMFRVWQFGRL